MTLTQSALTALDEEATRLGLNRSEIVERLARGLAADLTPAESQLLGESLANC